MIHTHSVIIVGGGFSGLAAARLLHRAGISFVLLEARDRLGGRTYTQHPAPGKYIDMGGMWIGPTQDRMYALAREAGVPWYETYNEGKNIIDLAGRIKTYTGLIPKIDAVSLLNIGWVLKKLERLARSVSAQSPWTHRHASRWDAISLDHFVRTNCRTNAGYQVLCAGLETVFACALTEISLLHALFYMRSGTSLNTLLSIRQGAQQHRLAGGMQPLAERLAMPFIQSIRLNHAVEQIIRKNEGAEVKGKNFSFTAARVVMAVPPALASRIVFDPPLPLRKSQLLNLLPMGIVGKAVALYDKPFWRNQGFSGQVVTDDRQPFQAIFDGSPADGSFGVLIGFCLANRARIFFSRSEQERRELTLTTLFRYFGNQANTATHVTDHCWADEAWSQGGYAAVYPPGAWTNLTNALAEQTGCIHWAGTETAPTWYGYIEGAVRAGEREAEAIIANRRENG